MGLKVWELNWDVKMWIGFIWIGIYNPVSDSQQHVLLKEQGSQNIAIYFVPILTAVHDSTPLL
jgi:hypothetical protein